MNKLETEKIFLFCYEFTCRRLTFNIKGAVMQII